MGLSVFCLYPLLCLLQLDAKENAEVQIRQNISARQIDVYRDLEQNKEVTWEETGTEFHYKGSMYDVVRTESRNGHTIYYCFSDKEESKLFSLIEDLVSRQLDDSNTAKGNAAQVLLKLLVQVYVPSAQCTVSTYGNNNVRQVFGNASAPVPSDCYGSILIPPPKIV